MLLTICQHCKTFLPEGETLYPITIDEGAGMVSYKQVCQLCYSNITENNNSKLLLERR